MLKGTIKNAILCHLAVAGWGHVTEHADNEAFRAIAELVVDGYVREGECANGNLILVITAKGIQEVRS